MHSTVLPKKGGKYVTTGIIVPYGGGGGGGGDKLMMQPGAWVWEGGVPLQSITNFVI